jgi:hypothetical protein
MYLTTPKGTSAIMNPCHVREYPPSQVMEELVKYFQHFEVLNIEGTGYYVCSGRREELHG